MWDVARALDRSRGWGLAQNLEATAAVSQPGWSASEIRERPLQLRENADPGLRDRKAAVPPSGLRGPTAVLRAPAGRRRDPARCKQPKQILRTQVSAILIFEC